VKIIYVIFLISILTIISCTGNVQADNAEGESGTNSTSTAVISGPDTIVEGERALFKIENIDLTGAAFMWSVEPESAGILGSPTYSEVGFQAAANPGSSDIDVTITVEIFRDGAESIEILKTFQIISAPEAGSWVKQYAASGRISGYDICVDRDGFIYATGQTSGSGDLDPGPAEVRGINTGFSGFPSGDAYLCKFSPSGDLIWANIWGGMTDENEEDQGCGVAADSNGNVYVVGGFEGTCDFDPGPGVFELTSSLKISGTHHENELFLASFDSNGNFIWAKNLLGYGHDPELKIEIDKDDNIFLSGGGLEPEDLEYLLNGNEPDNDTYETVALVKFNTSGVLLWYVTDDRTGTDWGGIRGIDTAISSDGFIYQAGTFSGLVDMDPGPPQVLVGRDERSTSGSFLRKLSPDGEYIWSKTWTKRSEGSHSQLYCVTISDSGVVYTSGYFEGDIGSDDEPDRTLSSNLADEGQSMPGVFLISHTPDGLIRWAIDFGGGKAWDIPEDMLVAESGDIYLAGKFWWVQNDEITVLQDEGEDTQSGNLAIVGSRGELKWVGLLDDWYWVGCKGLDLDSDGNVYMLGYNDSGRLMNLLKLAPGEYWEKQ